MLLALTVSGPPEALRAGLQSWLPEALSDDGYVSSPPPGHPGPVRALTPDGLAAAIDAGSPALSCYELWEHGPLVRALIAAARATGAEDPDPFEAWLAFDGRRLRVVCALDEPGLVAGLRAVPRLGPALALVEVELSAALAGGAEEAEEAAEAAEAPLPAPALAYTSLAPRTRAALRRLEGKRRWDIFCLWCRAPRDAVARALPGLLRPRPRGAQPGAAVPGGEVRTARRALFRASRAAYRTAAPRPEEKRWRRFLLLPLDRGWTALLEDRGSRELEDPELADGLHTALEAEVLSYRRRDRDGFAEVCAWPGGTLLGAVGGLVVEGPEEGGRRPAREAGKLLAERLGRPLLVSYEDVLCRPGLAELLRASLHLRFGPSVAEETLRAELDLGLSAVEELLAAGEDERALGLLREVAGRSPDLEAQLLATIEELEQLILEREFEQG